MSGSYDALHILALAAVMLAVGLTYWLVRGRQARSATARSAAR